jgi:hypothetical protein
MRYCYLTKSDTDSASGGASKARRLKAKDAQTRLKELRERREERGKNSQSLPRVDAEEDQGSKYLRPKASNDVLRTKSDEVDSRPKESYVELTEVAPAVEDKVSEVLLPTDVTSIINETLVEHQSTVLKAAALESEEAISENALEIQNAQESESDVDFNTTEVEKSKFFNALQEVSKEPVDYARLNRELDLDSSDDELDAEWLKSLPIAGLAESINTGADLTNDSIISSLKDEQSVKVSAVGPEITLSKATNDNNVEHDYSMSFDSASEINNQELDEPSVLQNTMSYMVDTTLAKQQVTIIDEVSGVTSTHLSDIEDSILAKREVELEHVLENHSHSRATDTVSQEGPLNVAATSAISQMSPQSNTSSFVGPAVVAAIPATKPAPSILQPEVKTPSKTVSRIPALLKPGTPKSASKTVSVSPQTKRRVLLKTNEAHSKAASSVERTPKPLKTTNQLEKKSPPKPAIKASGRSQTPTKIGEVPLTVKTDVAGPTSELTSPNQPLTETIMKDFLDTVTRQQTQIKEQEDELSSLRDQVNSRIVETTTLSDQIKFLEAALKDEQENNKSSRKALKEGPVITEKEAAELRKEIAEQESLINGVNTSLTQFLMENEKLVQQNKELKRQLKESEHLNLIKQENLIREKARVQINKPVVESGDQTIQQVAQQRAKIEELESTLTTQQHVFKTSEEDHAKQLAKLGAQLNEACLQLTELQGADPEQLKFMQSKQMQMKERYDAYIVELETKLEWCLETQGDVHQLQQQNKLLEAAIRDSSLEMEAISREKNLKSVKRQPMDIRRISELETKVKLMQQEITKLSKVPFAVSEIIQAPRPTIESADYIRHIKSRQKILEEQLEKSRQDADGTITSLRENVFLTNVELSTDSSAYQKKINDLESKIEALQADISVHSSGYKSAMQKFEKKQHVYESKITSLQSQLADHNQVAVKVADAEILDLDSEKTIALERRIVNLRNRITELEALVDQQAIRNEQLLSDKNKLQRDLSYQIKEKDEVIVSYESKLLSIQKEVHNKIFAVDEASRLQELHRLQRDIDSKDLELNSLRMKLEISEGTREAVHETTKSILKQTQEESSKLVSDLREKTFEMMCAEMRKDAMLRGNHLAHAKVQEYKSKSEDLEKRLATLTDNPEAVALSEERANLVEKVSQLELHITSLTRENKTLRDSYERSKEGWPPSLKKFENLHDHISVLEANILDRESKLSGLINSSPFDNNERQRLLKVLEQKDSQILSFQKEMDVVIDGIGKLKQQLF